MDTCYWYFYSCRDPKHMGSQCQQAQGLTLSIVVKHRSLFWNENEKAWVRWESNNRLISGFCDLATKAFLQT